MATYAEVSVEDLEIAHSAWPGDPYDKARVWAVVLRVRIERIAADLSPSIIAAPPDISMTERRLFLSIGQPGLNVEDERERTRVVLAATVAYRSLCDLLHGRRPEPSPYSQELATWTSAVDQLEAHLNVQVGEPARTTEPAAMTSNR